MIVYIQWLGRGYRCGAKGIHIPYSMGSLLELRMEFPTHMIVKMGRFMVVTWTDSYEMLLMKY